ncbi:MAG: MoaD/ThiS family protein [Deltaproteobacteria bacterium]|nr:MoaD/ThiS family protein [Deltaproteobacteria bacterium]MBW2361758.1 MoaD/ThiS family protein [Deltaproteobacteria bacterium]
MPTVIFSGPQRRLVNGDERVEIEAARVDELIRALYVRYPDLEGKLDCAAVSIDGDLHNAAKYLPLAPDAEVHFVGAVAGGSGTGPAESAS